MFSWRALLLGSVVVPFIAWRAAVTEAEEGPEPPGPREFRLGQALILWLPHCNIMGTASYLFADEASGSAALIDAAGHAKLLLQGAEKRGLKIDQLLLTHGHLDHIQAVPAYAKALGDKLKVWLHPGDRHMYTHHGVPLPFWAHFEPADYIVSTFVAYIFGMTRAPMPSTEPISESQEFAVGSLRLRVLSVPGHSPGSVVFHDPQSGVAFSGDCLMKGTVGRTEFPQGDEELMWESLRLLKKELPLNTTLFSGHTSPTTMEQEISSNPFLKLVAKLTPWHDATSSEAKLEKARDEFGGLSGF